MAQLISIDASGIPELAARLGTLTPAFINEKLVTVVNRVTDETYALAREKMLETNGLSDAYIQRKMRVDHATSQMPSATIAAPTGRGFHTLLSEYGAMVQDTGVTWSNARIEAMGKRFGAYPGWTRRTGNAAIGVAENRKAIGASVEVTRGRRKTMSDKANTFFVGSFRDGNGNPMLFKRVGSKIKSLYGPSPYQLFRKAADAIHDDVQANLQAAIITSVNEIGATV